MSTTKWILDPSHSELLFKVKHLMISNVKGEFKTFEAEVNGEDFTTSKVTVKIDANSIFTNNTDRDNHLKSADFFDTEQFPTLTFESTAFTKKSEDEFELVGDLTMKGVTKSVKLKAEFGGVAQDPWGNTKAGFAVSGKLNRKDFGLNWNAALEAGGVMVSEEVQIAAEVQFLKKTL